jgi:hypothetical protein
MILPNNKVRRQPHTHRLTPVCSCSSATSLGQGQVSQVVLPVAMANVPTGRTRRESSRRSRRSQQQACGTNGLPEQVVLATQRTGLTRRRSGLACRPVPDRTRQTGLEAQVACKETFWARFAGGVVAATSEVADRTGIGSEPGPLRSATRPTVSPEESQENMGELL